MILLPRELWFLSEDLSYSLMLEYELNKELVEHRFRVSSALKNALVDAGNSLPAGRSLLEPVDLVASIMRSSERGADLLKVVAGENFVTVLRRMEERRLLKNPSGQGVGDVAADAETFAITRATQKLIERAEAISFNRVITTDDIVTANLEESNSDLVSVLAEFEDNISLLPSLSSAISERIKYRESGVSTVIGKVTPVIIDDTPLERLSKRLVLAPTQGRETGHAVSQERNVKERKIKPVLVRKKWVRETLAKIETSKVVVIVTSEEDDARSIIQGLAYVLGNDKQKAFRYNRVVELDRDLSGVGNGRNLVLYVPYHENILANPTVRGAVAKDEVRLVTFMSNSEWRILDKKDPLIKEAKQVYLEPPTIKESIQLILDQKENLEERFSTENFRVKITKKAIEEAVRLSRRYIKNMLPLAGAKALLTQAATNLKIAYSGIKELGDPRVKKDTRIGTDDIRVALHHIAGIEVKPEGKRYLDMEKALGERVVGQDEAVERVSRAIRRAVSGLNDPKRPIGSFIFMGPSGVGKTELAKALAEFMFETEESLIRLDMSEYSEKHTVARLFGSPPGYVGYSEGGQLTEAVLRNPYSVILFDEIEKAHPEVANTLLQVLDEGRMTDGHGRVIDFKNTVIVMTGNVGSEYFRLEEELGKEKIREVVLGEIQDPERFKTEFLNRVDDVVVFNSLSKAALLKIADIQINKLNRILKDRGITVEITDKAKEFLVERSYTPEYGARPLVRTVEKEITDKLSVNILTGELKKKRFSVDIEKDELVIK